MNVYLAGPIENKTVEEANGWRDEITTNLEGRGILCINPLRCEPVVDGVYSGNYSDPRFGTPHAIWGKNKYDIDHSDLVLAHFPPQHGQVWQKSPVSIGTMIEMGYAHAYGIPIITWTQDPRVAAHPIVYSMSGWILDNMNDVLAVIKGLNYDINTNRG
jgi:nucleoside 2-deoxyribosyltransferase